MRRSSNDAGHSPERRCILTGAHGSRPELIRLALGPDNQVLPDLGAKAPGRGAWITPDARLLEGAIAKRKLTGALNRAFKTSAVGVPEDLSQRIVTGLQKRALDRLGLEAKAGHLIFGSDRIIDTARAGKLHALFHAADAATDGCSRLDQRWRASGGDDKGLRLAAGRDALSAATGRDNAVHIGVGDPAAAARVAAAVTRWHAYIGFADGAPAEMAPAVHEGHEDAA